MGPHLVNDATGSTEAVVRRGYGAGELPRFPEEQKSNLLEFAHFFRRTYRSVDCVNAAAAPPSGRCNKDYREKMLFRNYVLTRRYDFGRSTLQSWEFITRARGDDGLMNVSSWKELEEALRHEDGSDRLLCGAKATWKAYLHRKRSYVGLGGFRSLERSSGGS